MTKNDQKYNQKQTTLFENLLHKVVLKVFNIVDDIHLTYSFVLL